MRLRWFFSRGYSEQRYYNNFKNKIISLGMKVFDCKLFEKNILSQMLDAQIHFYGRFGDEIIVIKSLHGNNIFLKNADLAMTFP
jgi:hypothetical protein